jgi:alcohol dehydrogenase
LSKGIQANSDAKNSLIYGASGSVGSAAVQLAKTKGLYVTAVCSEKNHAMVTELGADEVLDYKKPNFMEQLVSYDLIFDAVGMCPKAIKAEHLATSGSYITVNTPTSERTDVLIYLGDQAAEGKFKPYVEKSFPRKEIVAANRLCDSGHKKGNIVITMD